VRNIDVLIEGYLDWKDPQDIVELYIEVHIDWGNIDTRNKTSVFKTSIDRAKDIIKRMGGKDIIQDTSSTDIPFIITKINRGKMQRLKADLWNLEEKMDNVVEFIIKGK
jgi:hypothetical protein